MTYTHSHVSELPDSPVVECTWATGVELARAALAGSSRQPPATAAEREALRAAGGGSDTSGATYDQLAVGLGNRYGLFTVPTLALPATEIPEGVFLGVQGLYSRLPTWYRRWDTAFTGAHSLVVYKLGGFLRVCDPLTPWDASWRGDLIAWVSVVAFHTALLGAKVIAVKLPQEADMALGWKITAFEGGNLTVKGTGHSAVRLRDGVYLAQPAGLARPYAAKIALDTALPGGIAGADRRNGYLIGEDVCILLASDVTAVPNTTALVVAAPVVPDVKHTVTLQIDGVTSFTKAV
jgi:hypothetical protein